MFITEKNYNLTYVIGEKNGKCITATENNKAVTMPGWLIWSSCNHGCGVVYRRKDGKMVLLTGVQGDFSYII